MNTRRDALKLIGVGALGAAASGLAAESVAHQQRTLAAIPRAFSADAEPLPLSFEADGLDGISEKVIVSHWKNNYAGSVRALNIIRKRLSSALEDDEIPAFVYNNLKREHLMRTGSVILHELYFGNLAPPGDRSPDLDRSIASAFGSVAVWEREFTRIGAGLGGGSGWVMTGWNHHLGSLENYWMADHMHCPVHVSPILVMDMYEHSYHMDYGAAAGQYIDAFMRNIDWQVAAERLVSARSQGSA